MPTFRCPRCALDVVGQDRFQVCRLCKFKGYFVLVPPGGAPRAEGAGEAAEPSGPKFARYPGDTRQRLAKPTFVLNATPTPAPAKTKRKPRDSWLRSALLRLLADGKGSRGEGPSLWQLLPPSAIASIALAGTAFGVLLALAPHGGIAALRRDELKFGLLTLLDFVALGMGWIEWWRHRGERWGIFARFLGGTGAVIGGAYGLVILIDVVLSAL